MIFELSRNYKRAFELIKNGDRLVCLLDYEGCRDVAANIPFKWSRGVIDVSARGISYIYLFKDQVETSGMFERICNRLNVEFYLPSEDMNSLEQKQLCKANCDEQNARHNREYGKAIAIVRTVYQVPIDAITGLKVEDVQDIESSELHPNSMALSCYAKALGLGLDEFLDKVSTNVDLLKVKL